MSFKKSFFKNISSFATFSYISQGFEFFSTIILSRLLVPEEYGFVAIILVFSGFMQLFSSLGIQASIVRSDYGRTYHKHLNSLAIWIGFGLALSMMVLAYPIAVFFDNNNLIIPTLLVSFRFVFESLEHVPSAYLSKMLKFNKLGVANLLKSSFQIVFTITLAFLGFSYWSLIIPLIFSPLVAYAYLNKHVGLPLKLYGWRATKMIFLKIRSLMGHLSLSHVFTYWSGNMDKVIVARLYTQADLGLYNRAFRFIMIATNLIANIFSRVLFPSLKQLMKEKGDVSKEFLDILRIISLFNMPIVLILLLFPKELVLILWGNDWIGVSDLLPYVAVILIFTSMFRAASPVYLLYNSEKMYTRVNIFNAVTRLIFIIIGGLISINHILMFIVLNSIFVNLPVQAYFGFYKSFGYNKKVILKFWIPNMLIGFGLFLSIYFDNIVLRVAVLIIFNILLLVNLRTTIWKTLEYLTIKIKTNKS